MAPRPTRTRQQPQPVLTDEQMRDLMGWASTQPLDVRLRVLALLWAV